MSNRISFDGTYMTKPTKAKTRLEFLKRANEERINWEKQELRNKSAKLIQRHWRRVKDAKYCQNRWRQEFDLIIEQKSNGTLLTADEFAMSLSQLLLRFQFFFDVTKDESRLLFLCQQLLAVIRTPNLMQDNHKIGMIYGIRFRSLIGGCVQYIGSIAHDSLKPFVLPLRVIEEYAFKDAKLTSHILHCGYMTVLLSLLVKRIPAGDLNHTHPSPKAPTPMAESVFMAMLHPINKQHVKSVQAIRELCLECLHKEVLNVWPPASVTICYIIPAIGKLCSQDMSLFTDLLMASQTSKCHKTAAVVYSYLSLAIAVRDQLGSLNSACQSAISRCVIDGFGCILKEEFMRKPDLREEFSEDTEEFMEVDSPKADMSMYLYKPCEMLSIRCMELMEDTGMMELIVPREYSPSEQSVMDVANLVHVLAKISRTTNYSNSRMYSWSFQAGFMNELWQLITNIAPNQQPATSAPRPLVTSLINGDALSPNDRDKIIPVVSLFASLLTNILNVVDENDFWEMQSLKKPTSLMPFSKSMLRSICAKLRGLSLGLIELAYPDVKPVLEAGYREVVEKLYGKSTKSGMAGVRVADPADAAKYGALLHCVVKTLQLLHERDASTQFCGASFWSWHDKVTAISAKLFRRSARGIVPMFDVSRIIDRDEWEMESTARMASPQTLRTITILRQIPFVVPFNDRVQILQSLVMQEWGTMGRAREWSPHANLAHIKIRRNFMYEDGISELSKENVPDLRAQIKVTMTNWANMQEAGIDGGGLFREFLNEVLKDGFDPKRGLFVSTSENTLYPNPLAPQLYEDFEKHYFFLGRLLGKLLYENQMVELRFANFFLWKVTSSASRVVDIQHVKSYDKVLYRNLLELKHMTDDCSPWGLDFSVIVEELGVTKKIDLKINGREILVENSNKLEYINLVIDFYLNRRLHKQTMALRRGIEDVVDLDWLGMFGYTELQTLISGADDDIDVEDMRHHTHTAMHGDSGARTMEYFWQVVREMTPELRRKLLKFVTSCSRPPLLGFKDLFPGLSVQLTGNSTRLPSAATCMNLLKLPMYETKEMLRDKLYKAIESNAGFELS